MFAARTPRLDARAANDYLSRRSASFEGELAIDDSKPDGTPRKLMNVGKLATSGWHAQTSLPAGIEMTDQAFKEISG